MCLLSDPMDAAATVNVLEAPAGQTPQVRAAAEKEKMMRYLRLDNFFGHYNALP